MQFPKFGEVELVTGERLQSLADATVINREVRRFHRSLPSNTVLIHTDRTGLRRLVPENSLKARMADQLRKTNTLFVYTHLLPEFYDRILPQLTHPVVIIAHNSDARINEDHKALLDSPNILRCLTQSPMLKDTKIEPLPAGIANAQWDHGNLAALAREIAIDRPKTNLLYVNFSLHTHPSRPGIHAALSQRGFATISTGRDYRTYLAELAQHRFCLSPPGNAIEAHRTWEALYLGVVPLVPQEIADFFPELPMVGVTDWETIDESMLLDAWNQLSRRTFAFDKLKLSWWRARIAELRRTP